MSQAKVDRYKEEKKNRKELMAKEKRANAFRAFVGGAVLVVLLGWIGVSGYDMYKARVINNSLTHIDNYITIDKGEKDGIQTEMGVVNGNGIVGVNAVTAGVDVDIATGDVNLTHAVGEHATAGTVC